MLIFVVSVVNLAVVVLDVNINVIVMTWASRCQHRLLGAFAARDGTRHIHTRGASR